MKEADVESDCDIASSSAALRTDDPDFTHWRHVRYHGDDQDSPLPKPWVLKNIEGQGFAAFATRSFQPGDWICTEFPTVWIRGHHPFSAEQVADIVHKVAQLDDGDKQAFFAMANVFHTHEFPVEVGIFMTNCFDMTDTVYGEPCCAMYLALARLNHSCTPNVQQTHIPGTTEEVLYASRAIQVGEEINDCYIELRQNRAQRRKELQEFYRFHCTCTACSYSPSSPELTEEERSAEEQRFEANALQQDTLRVQAGKLSDEVVRLIENDHLKDAMELGAKMAIALEAPDALWWSIRYLPEVHQDNADILTMLAQLSNKQKKKFLAGAKLSLKKAYKLCLQLQGPNSPETIRMKAKLDAAIS